MKHIKVKTATNIEADLEQLGAKPRQARVIGAVIRGVAADLINEREDTIRFACHGVRYTLKLVKE